MLKNSQQLAEEITELKCEAKGLVQVAKDANNGQGREFNPEEKARFDLLTNKDPNVGLIAGLMAKRQEALKLEATIAELHSREQQERAIQDLDSDEEISRPRQVLASSHSRRTAGNDRIYVKAAKLKAFKSEKDAWDAGMWYRAVVSKIYNREDKDAVQHCIRAGMDISNSAYEGSGSAGGYLVPPQIASTIIEVRENVGIARQVCEIVPMTSDMISIPKRAGGLTVYYPAELGTITDSDKSWAQIALAAQKRAVASKISQELVDDALISIVDNVVTEQAYALALQEDNELINGTGASTYGGVYGLKSAIGSAGTYTCDSNENLWSEIDLEDVMATMAKLPDRFNRNPVWICSSNFYWAVFARLLAAGGGNTIANLQGGVQKSFLGVPVLTTSQMPTADSDSAIHALFGQFDMAVILGDRTGIRVGRDDSLGFLSDYTTLKATARYDIKVHEPGDSSNAGAYVALKTNAA